MTVTPRFTRTAKNGPTLLSVQKRKEREIPVFLSGSVHTDTIFGCSCKRGVGWLVARALWAFLAGKGVRHR